MVGCTLVFSGMIHKENFFRNNLVKKVKWLYLVSEIFQVYMVHIITFCAVFTNCRSGFDIKTNHSEFMSFDTDLNKRRNTADVELTRYAACVGRFSL